MIPTNRYVRDRQEKLQEASLDEVFQSPQNQAKNEKEGNGESQRSGPLRAIEQPQEVKLRALPEGRVRNLKYEGPLTEKQLDRVEDYYPFYKQAEKITGVNWRVLAGIHYRESSLGVDPKAKGNEFQFDGVLKNKVTGKLLTDLIQTGKILQEKAKIAKQPSLLSDQCDTENVKQALFGYNGKIYKQFVTQAKPSYDRSPYVLNRLDQDHSNMSLYLGKEANPSWSVDHRFGVIPFANELAKAFPVF